MFLFTVYAFTFLILPVFLLVFFIAKDREGKHNIDFIKQTMTYILLAVVLLFLVINAIGLFQAIADLVAFGLHSGDNIGLNSSIKAIGIVIMLFAIFFYGERYRRNLDEEISKKQENFQQQQFYHQQMQQQQMQQQQMQQQQMQQQQMQQQQYQAYQQQVYGRTQQQPNPYMQQQQTNQYVNNEQQLSQPSNGQEPNTTKND